MSGHRNSGRTAAWNSGRRHGVKIDKHAQILQIKRWEAPRRVTPLPKQQQTRIIVDGQNHSTQERSKLIYIAANRIRRKADKLTPKVPCAKPEPLFTQPDLHTFCFVLRRARTICACIIQRCHRPFGLLQRVIEDLTDIVCLTIKAARLRTGMLLPNLCNSDAALDHRHLKREMTPSVSPSVNRVKRNPLSLPYEIRQQIWTYVLSRDRQINICQCLDPPHAVDKCRHAAVGVRCAIWQSDLYRLFPALPLVCRQIYIETKTRPWTPRALYIGLCSEGCLTRFLELLGIKRMKFIR